MRVHPSESRILIVDDAPAVRESLGWLIEDEPGMTVVGDASTASQAILETVRLSPDLILLDIELPDADGFTVTRRIKAMANPPLVVLLSVHGDEQSRQGGAEAGCDAYVEKGSGWPRLLQVLRETLEKRKSE
jgi:DNA-binding NarL/FixJ family response regulator